MMEIQKYVADYGLTQAQVQQITGMNPSEASYLLNGKVSRFSLPRLVEIAKLFKGEIDLKVTFPQPEALGL